MTNAPLDPASAAISEDAIIAQLVRLIELCEQAGLDLDLMMNEAQRIHSGEPEIGR